MIAVEDRAAELYGLVRGCTLCALSATRTHAVPGEGPLDAEVMCIGEAPGVNEDKQGRPFVGAAGQFLGELLAAAGLTREHVYICNVLKCRPPGNRDPLPNEIEACSEYLDLQLDMVDPRVIITLGRFSMSKWFPQQAISRIHGSVKEVDGRLIVPMYHPAAALHQGNLRQVLLDDFARIPAILERARTLTANSPTGAPPTRATTIRAATGKERLDADSPTPPDAATLTPNAPVRPAPIGATPIRAATGKERLDADSPAPPIAGTLTPRPPLPSLGEGETGSRGETPRIAEIAAPDQPSHPVVPIAETPMMERSEQAAASPQPAFEPEAPATDVTPAGSPDSSAAEKTEQIRLFE